MRLMRKIREEKGVSLDQLAKATGVDKAALSRFERFRDVGMQQRNLEAVARELSVTIDELLADAPTPEAVTP